MRTLDEAGVISDQDRLLLHEVKHIVRRLLPTADVLLYGSVARGTQDAESDYDILVLTDSPISKEDRCEIERMLLDLELLRCDPFDHLLFQERMGITQYMALSHGGRKARDCSVKSEKTDYVRYRMALAREALEVAETALSQNHLHRGFIVPLTGRWIAYYSCFSRGKPHTRKEGTPCFSE